MRDRTVEENIKITTEVIVIPEIAVGVNLGKFQYPEALITEEMIGVQVTVVTLPSSVLCYEFHICIKVGSICHCYR